MAGKYISPKKRHWAPFVVILAVVALVATIGGTMAWLTASPSGLTNTFTPANVEIAINETFNADKTAKTGISIANTGDADVYVRVAVVSNFIKGDNETICGEHIASKLAINLGNDWVESGGYYYYTKAIAVGASTENLLNAALTLTANDGCCKQQVTVLAQVVQAEPTDAVTQAWGFVPGDSN